MSTDKSAFWRGFDRVERAVGKPLEDLVASTGYADVLVHGLKLQRAVGGLVGQLVAGSVGTVLRAVNLPTGRDVQRLSRQLAVLTSEVRALSLQQRDQQPTRALRAAETLPAAEPQDVRRGR